MAFQGKGCGFGPWSGSSDPTSLTAGKPKLKTEKSSVITSIKTLKSGLHKKRKKKSKRQQHRQSEGVLEYYSGIRHVADPESRSQS